MCRPLSPTEKNSQTQKNERRGAERKEKTLEPCYAPSLREGIRLDDREWVRFYEDVFPEFARSRFMLLHRMMPLPEASRKNARRRVTRQRTT